MTSDIHREITKEVDVKGVESSAQQSHKREEINVETHKDDFKKIKNMVFSRGIRRGGRRKRFVSSPVIDKPFSYWQDERKSLLKFFKSYVQLDEDKVDLSPKLDEAAKIQKKRMLDVKISKDHFQQIIWSLERLGWELPSVEIYPIRYTFSTGWREKAWGWVTFEDSPFKVFFSSKKAWEGKMREIDDAQDSFDNFWRLKKLVCWMSPPCQSEKSMLQSRVNSKKEELVLEVAAWLLDRMNQSS